MSTASYWFKMMVIFVVIVVAKEYVLLFERPSLSSSVHPPCLESSFNHREHQTALKVPAIPRMQGFPCNGALQQLNNAVCILPERPILV